MNESSLKKLSKSQLIKLLLQQNVELQSRKPITAPRKSVKQMVQDYEDNIILPPLEFRFWITNQRHNQGPKNLHHYQGLR